MSTIKHLIRKEFLQIWRNPFLPKFIVVFPVVIMCVMPWVMNMEVKNIVVEVVDNDRSPFSQQLVHRIEASRYFIFHGQKPDYKAALKDVERSEADLIVEIPPGFSRDRQNGRNAQILIAANSVNGTKGMMGSKYMSQIVSQHLAVPVLARSEDTVSVLYLYNKHLNYKLFMIPALMAILIMLICGTLPALNIVGEKEAGTIEAINVTPISKLSFILAKLIPYWLIAVIVMTICFLLSWLAYGITSAGSLALVYLLALLLAFVISGFGLVISNYNDTMQQAMFVLWFFVMIFLLMSSLFTPVRSMPEWAQMTTVINPIHYFIDGIRTVFVRGGDLRNITREVGALALIALLMDLWAVVSYKKNRR